MTSYRNGMNPFGNGTDSSSYGMSSERVNCLFYGDE